MHVVISRDPFARHDIVRSVVPLRERTECAWCGHRPGKFRYGVDPDSIGSRTSWDVKAFCCKSCRNAYQE